MFDLLVLEGYVNMLSSAAFSWDGQMAVSSSGGCDVRVWDVSTRHKMQSSRSHRGNLHGVEMVAFSQDGKLIVSVSESRSRTASVWDACTGHQVLKLEGHTRQVLCAVFSQDGTQIVTGSADQTARTWDVSTGRQLLTLEGHGRSVRAVSFSRDKSMIVTFTLGTSLADCHAQLWDGSIGQKMQMLEGHGDEASSVSFSHDGTRMVFGMEDLTVCIMETGRAQHVLRGHSDIVHSVAFSPDDKLIASGSADGTARLWDTVRGHPLDISTKFLKPVKSVKFYSISPVVVQFQIEGEIRYWTPCLTFLSLSIYNPDILSTPPGPLDFMYSIENRLVIATSRGAGQKPIPIGRLPPSFRAKSSDVHGSTMVVGGEDGEVYILKLPTYFARS